MVQPRQIHLLPFLCLFCFFFSCSLSNQDIEAYLQQGDYEPVYSFVATQIEDRSAAVNKYIIEEPAIFETALLGLLSSNTEYATRASLLLKENYTSIRNHQVLESRIWKTFIDKEVAVPQGLHELLLRKHDHSNVMYRSEKLDRFTTDPSFKKVVMADIQQYIETSTLTSGNLRDVQWLAKLISFTNLAELAKELEITNKQLKETRSDYKYVDSGVENAFRYVEDAKKKYEDQKEIIDNSYILMGYMVSLYNDNYKGGHVYEIRNLVNNDIMLLITFDSQFTRQGHFKLRVTDVADLPMRLKQKHGGFKTDIKVVLEFPESSIEKYNEAKRNYQYKIADAQHLDATKEERKRTLFAQLQTLEKKSEEIHINLTNLVNEHISK